MFRIGFLVALLVGALGCGDDGNGGAIDENEFSADVFASPPAEFGPQTRWWWPGGAVDDATLREQLGWLADAGYGAVEIQPFMAALTSADLREDPRIRTVGAPTFLEHLHTAGCAAQGLGLSWDLTFGSGWSTGGPDLDAYGARQRIAAEVTLTGPSSYSGPLPKAESPGWVDFTNNILLAIDGFDEALILVSVLAAEILDDTAGFPVTLGDVIDLTSNVADGTLTWEIPAGNHRVLAIYENRTFHFPAGGAYPGELEDARILDHLDRQALQAFLEREFRAWIEAVADCPPRAVFVDSFELVGELPWTTDFGSRFETSLGYDIEPMLPFLFLQGGESEYVNIVLGEGPARYRAADERGLRAREDYEAFRGTLFTEEFIAPLRSWLRGGDIQLRLQSHGGYADVLDAYGMADVPESEGLYGGGSYDFLRLSASAAHVAGKRHVSSETFPSLAARHLTENETRILMGRAFSAGINRLVHHGNAYPYVQRNGQRWYPFHPHEDSVFTAGPLDISFDIHPDGDIWPILPALNRWQARLSYALSRGSSAAEVAWLYPRWDAENFPNAGIEPGAYESETSITLRRAGFGYDRISRSALAASTSAKAALQVGEASYQALLVEGAHAAAPEMLRAIERAIVAGVPVVWVGEFPARAEGLVDAESRDAQVGALVASLRSTTRVVTSVAEIPTELSRAGVTPSLSPIDPGGLRLSVERRRIIEGDLYFLFNESYEQRTDRMRIVAGFTEALLFDPDTGAAIATQIDDDVLTVALPGARGAVLRVVR